LAIFIPTLTHAFITGALGLLLYIITQNSPRRFKAEHIIVFALNGFIGPDISKFFSPFFGAGYWENPIYIGMNQFIHSIIGWLIVAIPLAGIYFALFLRTKEKKETGQSPISYIHIYFLIIAAGFNHFGIDMLDYPVRLLPAVISNQYWFGLEMLQTGYSLAEGPLWSSFGWFDDKYLLIIGLGFMILLIWLLKNKPVKWALIAGLIFGLIVYGTILLIGSNIVANEHDIGYLIYAFFAWIGPLLLCYASMEKNKLSYEDQKQE
jgi:hypothetical protein